MQTAYPNKGIRGPGDSDDDKYVLMTRDFRVVGRYNSFEAAHTAAQGLEPGWFVKIEGWR